MSLPHLESVLRRSSLSLHLSSPSLFPSHRWRFYNLSAIEIQQTFLNLFAWLHFGRAFSQRASAEPHGGRGGGISVSWLPPAGTFCICLQHSSIALAAAVAALVVAVVASRPRGGARLVPTVLIFIHSVNMQIARPEPGLACRGGNKASHFTTSSNCVGRILAEAPRCLKTFLAKCFFSLFFGQSNMLPHLSLLFEHQLMIRFSA